MAEPQLLFQQLGISLLLGLLVGLQRQRTEPHMPGVRTFPLITVLGTLCGALAGPLGGWMAVAGLLALAVLTSYANFLRYRREDPDPGTTTEVAALVMYGVGVLLAVGPMEVAVAVGGGVAVLLHLKPQMHRFAERLGDEDIAAIMQFVLITCIILPVLPNKTYDPWHVLNPFETWLIVVLIVGMSLGGYIVYKFFGRDAGLLLGGVLGGAISSTATTVSYARQARDDRGAEPAVAVVILIASTVAMIRVLAAVAVVSPAFLRTLIAPVLIVTGLMLVPALVLWFRVRREPSPPPDHQNPTHLKSAIAFAVLYAAMLLALAYAKQFGQTQGMMVVAALSGLTDMDAITLSTARMSLGDPAVAESGWRLILVAALANVVAKTFLAGIMGGWRLMVRVGLWFGVPLAGGLVVLWTW